MKQTQRDFDFTFVLRYVQFYFVIQNPIMVSISPMISKQPHDATLNILSSAHSSLNTMIEIRQSAHFTDDKNHV